ncbi:hypothetical protein ACHAWF_017672 [Thalassiosira exigua]
MCPSSTAPCPPSSPAVDIEVAISHEGEEDIRIVHPVRSSRQPAIRSTFWTPCRKYTAALFFSAIIAASVFWYMNHSSNRTSSDSDFDIFDPSTWMPDWLDSNPHGGDTPYDFSTWDTKVAGKNACTGLELAIVDKLDDKWTPYFEQAVADWEGGEPDVLTLNVRKDSFYQEFGGCDALQGVLVVCNGDYGNTDWVGINHAVIQLGHIVSSVAKMNDYVLDKLGDAAKQWTMCHELGHGFGLGHWDEDFYNKDLYNCMDYTHAPENNQHPDRTNFLFLEHMYGNVAGTSMYYDNVEGTEGLYCTSTQSDYLEYLDERKLGSRRSKLTPKTGLSDEEFSRIAGYFNEPIPGRIEPMADERFLKSNRHERVVVKDFPNGVQVMTTFHLA